MNLVYSQEAIADLKRLRDFIADNDPTAAARIAADLVTRIDSLCAFPEMGVASRKLQLRIQSATSSLASM